MNPSNFISLVELLGNEGKFSRKNISWHWIMLFFCIQLIFSSFSLSCSACFPRFLDFGFILFLFLFVFFSVSSFVSSILFFLMSVCLYVLHFSILFPSFHSFIIHLPHCFGDLTSFRSGAKRGTYKTKSRNCCSCCSILFQDNCSHCPILSTQS